MSQSSEGIRLDKWLWAARFFKHRKLATEAIQGGKVHLNGQRVKPSKNVLKQDLLEITRGQEEFTVVVLELSDKRGPATQARTLYEETAESQARRYEAREMRRLQASDPAAAHRPDKRDRRRLRAFTGKR